MLLAASGRSTRSIAEEVGVQPRIRNARRFLAEQEQALAVRYDVDELAAARRTIDRIERAAARQHPTLSPGKRLQRAAKLKERARTRKKQAAKVVREIRKGNSLSAAAKKAGVSTKTARELAGDKIAKSKKGKYEIAEGAPFKIIDDEGNRVRTSFSPREISTVYSWSDAIDAALTRRDPSLLKKSVGLTVRDVHGKKYRLNTHYETLSALYRQSQSNEEEWGRYAPFRSVASNWAWRYAA